MRALACALAACLLLLVPAVDADPVPPAGIRTEQDPGCTIFAYQTDPLRFRVRPECISQG